MNSKFASIVALTIVASLPYWLLAVMYYGPGLGTALVVTGTTLSLVLAYYTEVILARSMWITYIATLSVIIGCGLATFWGAVNILGYNVIPFIVLVACIQHIVMRATIEWQLTHNLEN